MTGSLSGNPGRVRVGFSRGNFAKVQNPPEQDPTLTLPGLPEREPVILKNSKFKGTK